MFPYFDQARRIRFRSQEKKQDAEPDFSSEMVDVTGNPVIKVMRDPAKPIATAATHKCTRMTRVCLPCNSSDELLDFISLLAAPSKPLFTNPWRKTWKNRINIWASTHIMQTKRQPDSRMTSHTKPPRTQQDRYQLLAAQSQGTTVFA